MSFEVNPIIWTSQTRSRGSSTPVEFRLNLAANNPSTIESGLRFSNALETRSIKGGNSHAQKPVDHAISDLIKGPGRLFLASQILIVLTLAILIFTLLAMSLRLNYNVNYYYEASLPYMSQFSNHSLGILRHTDVSTQYLESVMAQTHALANTSIPELMDSVNRTAAMVARLQHVAQNPVVRLSMG
jgi:hypothetical protein